MHPPLVFALDHGAGRLKVPLPRETIPFQAEPLSQEFLVARVPVPLAAVSRPLQAVSGGKQAGTDDREDPIGVNDGVAQSPAEGWPLDPGCR